MFNAFADEAVTEINISYQNKKLSVLLENAELLDVLFEISQKTGIKIIRNHKVRYHPVTKKFDELELEQGLAKILKGVNYLIFYAPEQAGEKKIESLALLPPKSKVGIHSSPQRVVIPEEKVHVKKNIKPQKPVLGSISSKEKSENVERINLFEKAIKDSLKENKESVQKKGSKP
ncbi:MAG: hypothetical protein HQK84_05130 [Nitrospinae bacterium]|nr:hypothetical protein [Nitrospinota bacterium]